MEEVAIFKDILNLQVHEFHGKNSTDIIEFNLEETFRNNDDHNNTIHPFNASNITVIENSTDILDQPEATYQLFSPSRLKQSNCELKELSGIELAGSDSGVEILESNDSLSKNRHQNEDFPNYMSSQNHSRDSSFSCCSNYDDVYSLLVRRNSTLLDDYKKFQNSVRKNRNVSESSSPNDISNSSASSRYSEKVVSSSKKKSLNCKTTNVRSADSKDRCRSKSAVTPKHCVNPSPRLKSVDRLQSKSINCNLVLFPKNSSTKKVYNADSISNPRDLKQISLKLTNTRHSEDGRWPSVNSKPAALMSKSCRGVLESGSSKKVADLKVIETYATLPRPHRLVGKIKLNESRESSLNRLATPKNPVIRKDVTKKTPQSYKKARIKTFHENSSQTVLTLTELNEILEESFAGSIPHIHDTGIQNTAVQADFGNKKFEELEVQFKGKTFDYEELCSINKDLNKQLKAMDEQLLFEHQEKINAQKELDRIRHRVLNILGDDPNVSEGDGNLLDILHVFETRYSNTTQVVIDQQHEISELNGMCRALRTEVDKSKSLYSRLIHQQEELEAESLELQEFMQAEKSTLSDAMKETEAEINRFNVALEEKDKQIQIAQDECKHLVRLNEQQHQENMTLQAKLETLETKYRGLILECSSSVSGTVVGLSSLISRLESLIDELITSYNITEEELEDVVYHNEMCTSLSSSISSNESTLEDIPKSINVTASKGSSFVSAVINAIKNGSAQTPFVTKHDASRTNFYNDTQNSTEMLDLETEPCLMMEPVLEDVLIPDGHSHNMISSSHMVTLNSSLHHSESLKDLSQAITNREISEQVYKMSQTYTIGQKRTTNKLYSFSLIDLVIDVDNTITRLLKVIRTIQMGSEDCMNELEEQKDKLTHQIGEQNETNKFVAKQLKDWEILGARLKSEVSNLTKKIKNKDDELDLVKNDLVKQRGQLEKQNQDICELSTALSTLENQSKSRTDQIEETISIWESSGTSLSPKMLAEILISKQEAINNLRDKESCLKEITADLEASKDIFVETLGEALSQVKKQYGAIDKALEVLHNVQGVVQQCPSLAQLQQDLKEISFDFASSSTSVIISSDSNANAALLQAMNNMRVKSPINMTV